VGSRTISRSRHDALSAATIRNTMADLADEGYLSQPHTSAGRVPTEKAFRVYVRSLAARRIAPEEAERMRAELAGVHTVEERIERCSRMLTELTRNVGIAAAMPATAQELDQIELIPLADRRVLMILVTRDHMVRNRVVALDEPLSPEDLVSIRNYVNRNFSGWKLWDARRELLRRLADDRALYEELRRKLEALYQRGLLHTDASPEIHMEGASNLIGLDLHLTREKLRDLMRALEEKQRLIELLDRFLEQPRELNVQVGLEDVHPSMKELALIGVSFALPTGLTARVAVLGPVRMQYQKVMSAVLHLGYALEHLPF
jgi:heat-inducible transcriptional repressor